MVQVVTTILTLIVHNKDGNDHDIVHLDNEHVVCVTVPTHDDKNYDDDDDDPEEDDDGDDDDDEEEEGGGGGEWRWKRRISSVGSDTIPSCQVPKQSRPSAAVIGSGMSGLIAAHLLEETHEVGNDVGFDDKQVNPAIFLAEYWRGGNLIYVCTYPYIYTVSLSLYIYILWCHLSIGNLVFPSRTAAILRHSYTCSRLVSGCDLWGWAQVRLGRTTRTAGSWNSRWCATEIYDVAWCQDKFGEG